jgi:hypothetical protein
MPNHVGPACKSLLHKQFQLNYRDRQLVLRLPLMGVVIQLSRMLCEVALTAVRDTAPTTGTTRDVLLRVQGEYRDMPGLKLTEAQAQRLLGIDCDTCAVVLSTLIERRFLRRTASGQYVRAWD